MKKTVARLQVDPQATGELAEQQEAARLILKEAGIPFSERFAKNDWRDGTFTPTLQISREIYTGVDLIRAYAKSVHKKGYTKHQKLDASSVAA